MLREKKLFIFDWDGTLLDSQQKIVSCMRASAVDNGLLLRSDSDYANVIGLGLAEAFGMLYPKLDEVGIALLKGSYSRHFVEADQVPCRFFPGALEALNVLKQQGSCIAVATGKSRKGLHRVLSMLQMQDFFDETRCADETQSKPNPQMLREILCSSDMRVEDAVMIGDTEYDLAMAAALDMETVAVRYGVHDIVRLEKYKPRMCVDNLMELLQ